MLCRLIWLWMHKRKRKKQQRRLKELQEQYPGILEDLEALVNEKGDRNDDIRTMP